MERKRAAKHLCKLTSPFNPCMTLAWFRGLLALMNNRNLCMHDDKCRHVCLYVLWCSPCVNISELAYSTPGFTSILGDSITPPLKKHFQAVTLACTEATGIIHNYSEGQGNFHNILTIFHLPQTSFSGQMQNFNSIIPCWQEILHAKFFHSSQCWTVHGGSRQCHVEPERAE